MRIVGLEACTLVVPLSTPVQFATRDLHERYYTVVRVRTEAGIEGRGFCYSGNRAGHIVTLLVRDLLRTRVLGQDADTVERIWDDMFRETLLLGRRGAALRAMSAVDLALWDVRAKAVGLPLHRYLGAYREDSVPAYASGGYYADSKGPSELADEVEAYVRMGFKAVKIKVGRLSPQRDAERIAAARSAVGPDIHLFLDANNAWRDLSSARHALAIWQQYGPGWIEEPFMPDEVDLHAMLAESSDVPVATGEIENGHWGFKALLDKCPSVILQADAGVCGGVTEWRKIAALAQSYGTTIAPHWLAEVHVHLVAVTANATWVEYFVDQDIANWSRCFKSALQITDGNIVLPNRPGLGIEWDESAVARFTFDGWH